MYKSLEISRKIILSLFWAPGNIHFRCKSRETETEKGRTEVRPVMKCMFDCVWSVLLKLLGNDVVKVISVSYNSDDIMVITEELIAPVASDSKKIIICRCGFE